MLERLPPLALTYAWVACTVFGASAPAHSQDSATEEGRKRLERKTESFDLDLPPRLLFETSPPDLFASQMIQVLHQDDEGYIWAGTQGGLTRLAGEAARTFGESEFWITSLSSATNGDVWVGTAEHGLLRYNARSGAIERPDFPGPLSLELRTGNVTSVLETTEALWILSPNSPGILRYELASKNVNHTVGDDLSFATLAVRDDATLWAGTVEGTVFVIDRTTGEALSDFVASPEGFAVVSLRPTKGAVWIGTNGSGVSLFDLTGNEIEHHSTESGLVHDEVNDILVDRHEGVWLATTGGLAYRRAGSKRFVVYTAGMQSYAPPEVNTLSLLEDAEGVIWVGTAVGLCRVHPRQLQSTLFGVNTPGGLVERDEVLWSANIQGLLRLNRDSSKGRIFRHPRAGFPDDPRTQGALVPWSDRLWAPALAAQRSGRLWVGYDGRGVSTFEPETELWRIYEEETSSPGPVGLQGSSVLDIHVDREDRVWAAPWGGGLALYIERIDNFVTLPDPSRYIHMIQEDRNASGVLWLGTADQGLQRYVVASGKVSATHGTENSNLPSNVVYSMYQSPSGEIWLGHQGEGLSKFDRASSTVVERVTTDDGLSSGVIHGIYPGEGEVLWLVGDTSVMQFRPGDGFISSYSWPHGFEIFQGCHSMSSKGELLLGGLIDGVRGILVINPAVLLAEKFRPPIVLTDIRVLGDTVPVQLFDGAPRLDISWRESIVTLQFAALGFSDPRQHEFQYRIDPLSQDWIDIGQPSLTLSGLGPGEYQVQVRLKEEPETLGQAGSVSRQKISLRLGISPPWWRTTWAYLAYGIVLCGLILLYAGYWRQRLRAAEDANQLRAAHRELELSSAVQRGFLPEANYHENDKVAVAGFYAPAELCSGDWWWYETTRDPNTHCVVMADVTGHGAGPAMVTAAVASTFRNQDPHLPVETRLSRLNQEVQRVGRNHYRLTALAVEYDQESGNFQCFSAGAPPCIKVSNNGTIKPLICRGIPLGSPEVELGKATGQLEIGDRLLMYTDGIPEITLRSGRFLGQKGMIRLLRKQAGLPLENILDAVATAARDLSASPKQEDDWTMALLERRS